MNGFRHTGYSTIQRRVTVDSGGAVVVVDAAESAFPVQFVEAVRSKPTSDLTSPRRAQAQLLRFRTTLFAHAGAPLRAGDRVSYAGVLYEVLAEEREVLVSRYPNANEVPILAVTKLYPLVGTLEEQGGADVQANVRFSAYSSDETHGSTGTYEDLDGECSIDLAPALRSNRQFSSGGKVFKITASETDLLGGHVRLGLRRSGL